MGSASAIIGGVLAGLTVRRLALVYFFLSPLFLDRAFGIIDTYFLYGLGYVFSAPLVLLGVTYGLMRVFEPARFRVSLAAFVFLGAMCLLSAAMSAPHLLGQNFWHFLLLWKVWIPMGCFFILINAFDRKDLLLLFKLMAVVGVASMVLMPAAIFFFPRLAFESSRYAFFFDDPNTFASFNAAAFGIAFALFIQKISRGQDTRGYGVLSLVLVIPILFSQSRSGIVSLLAVTLATLLASRNRKLLLRFFFILLPFLAMAAFILLARYTAAFGHSALVSDLGRIWTYDVAWNIIRERPLFGIGFGNLLASYNQYGMIYTAVMNTALVIHNAFLGIFAELGMGGAAAYLVIMLIPAFSLHRRIRSAPKADFPWMEMAAFNVLLVHIVYGLVYPYSLICDTFWTQMAFVYIVYLSGNGSGGHPPRQEPDPYPVSGRSPAMALAKGG